MSTKFYIHDITETDTRTTFTTGAGADETVVLYATAVFVTTTTTTAVVVVVVGLHTRAVRVLRAGNGSAYETVSVKGLTRGRGEVSAVQSHAHTRSKTGGRAHSHGRDVPPNRRRLKTPAGIPLELPLLVLSVC